jgi:hypothetical protein
MRIRACAACLLILIGVHVGSAQSLNVRLEGNQLRFVVTDLKFIAGDALQQLHNGSTVTYVLEAVVKPGRESLPSVTVTYRFAASYDLWEEKFAVTRLEPMPRSISHLSASAAEKWCLDSISVPVDSIAPSAPFWITLEYHAEQDAAGTPADAESTLARLVNILSLKKPRQELRSKREGGPFRLDDLRRNSPRNANTR